MDDFIHVGEEISCIGVHVIVQLQEVEEKEADKLGDEHDAEDYLTGGKFTGFEGGCSFKGDRFHR